MVLLPVEEDMEGMVKEGVRDRRSKSKSKDNCPAVAETSGQDANYKAKRGMSAGVVMSGERTDGVEDEVRRS